ncbi:hypothetical protein GOP47_0002329 [Adiantum capillus-veneris]|uniref:Uncharacterized protein n=1 Tax=Adiantum capillus-veneris TaxID=13818 RepID=A0A9D4ZQV9_ADICA|nr:hypothetical protein GOP47_0002329 [Adiantum capillus-veneris]
MDCMCLPKPASLEVVQERAQPLEITLWAATMIYNPYASHNVDPTLQCPCELVLCVCVCVCVGGGCPYSKFTHQKQVYHGLHVPPKACILGGGAREGTAAGDNIVGCHHDLQPLRISQR